MDHHTFGWVKTYGHVTIFCSTVPYGFKKVVRLMHVPGKLKINTCLLTLRVCDIKLDYFDDGDGIFSQDSEPRSD